MEFGQTQCMSLCCCFTWYKICHKPFGYGFHLSIFCPHMSSNDQYNVRIGNLSFFFLGRMLPLLRHCCAFGTHHPLSWGSIFQTLGREQKQIRSWSAQCSSNYEGASVPEKDNPLKNLTIPVNSLLDACILYCTSPALGHNKVSNFFIFCFTAEFTFMLHACCGT